MYFTRALITHLCIIYMINIYVYIYRVGLAKTKRCLNSTTPLRYCLFVIHLKLHSVALMFPGLLWIRELQWCLLVLGTIVRMYRTAFDL